MSRHSHILPSKRKRRIKASFILLFLLLTVRLRRILIGKKVSAGTSDKSDL